MSKRKEQKILKEVARIEQRALPDSNPLGKDITTLKELLVSYFAEKPDKPKSERKATETGLGKPRKITQKLADFMNLPATELRSRNDVTKAICQHTATHNLQDSANRKFIICDEALSTVLNLPLGTSISYTQIQLELNALFIEPSTVCNLIPTQALIDFTNSKWSSDDVISWNDVKKYFTLYIQEHKLRKKRKITLDAKLKELFETTENNEITQDRFNKYCHTMTTLKVD